MDSLSLVTCYASKLAAAGICSAFSPKEIFILRKFILPEIFADSTDENCLQNLIKTRLTPTFRSSQPEVFLGKVVQKICSKFTGEHPCRSCFATLLKLHFSMGVLLEICCIFSEHLFLRTPLRGCFWTFLFYTT